MPETWWFLSFQADLEAAIIAASDLPAPGGPARLAPAWPLPAFGPYAGGLFASHALLAASSPREAPASIVIGLVTHTVCLIAMGPAWKPVERPSMHNITDVVD